MVLFNGKTRSSDSGSRAMAAPYVKDLIEAPKLKAVLEFMSAHRVNNWARCDSCSPEIGLGEWPLRLNSISANIRPAPRVLSNESMDELRCPI